MKIIGLIGGIASGKSAVADALAALGAQVLDADRAAHRLLESPEIVAILTARWGERILKQPGVIDRRKLAEIVFDPQSGPLERNFLEQQLHPRLRDDFVRQIRNFSPQDTPAVVIDAPLLLEAGWADLCDLILYVDAPRETRLLRAREGRGWTAEEFTKREATQLPIEEKRARATDLVDNSGSVQDLQQAVERLWDEKILGQ